MKPNVSFIYDWGQGIYRIYPPLKPAIVGGKTIAETFQIAYEKGLIWNTEKVRVFRGDSRSKYVDIDFEDYNLRNIDWEDDLTYAVL